MSSSVLSAPIVPVILCGGGGTRLWPLSKQARPKPFLPLLGDRTLFQAALDRCSDTALFGAPVIVAGAAHVSLIEEQAGELSAGALIVEPQPKNTAPAVALAAARLPADAVMLVCPSDHYIADERAFAAAAQEAAKLAQNDWLVSLAISPNRPEVGFGYIKHAGELPGGFEVERFVEKPSLDRAKQFLDDGSYLWNAGIFAFRAGALLEELKQHRPELAELVMHSVADGHSEGAQFHPASAPFARIESESIDYAVMENTGRAAMVPADMGWSDIGNWASLQDALPADSNGNHAPENAEMYQSERVLVVSDGPRVSVVGLSDVCVVVDGDEVLVTTREAAPHVGNLSGAKGK